MVKRHSQQMRILGAIQQFIMFSGSILACTRPIVLSGRFYFASWVFGTAIIFSAIINPNKQRISEESHPGK